MAKDEKTVVLKHLCREFKIEPRAARRKLRATLGLTEGRWSWAEGSKELTRVRDVLRPKTTGDK